MAVWKAALGAGGAGISGKAGGSGRSALRDRGAEAGCRTRAFRGPRKRPRNPRGSPRELSEADFFPPEDPRAFRSGVSDVGRSDTFASFAEGFFEYCDEWGLYDG